MKHPYPLLPAQPLLFSGTPHQPALWQSVSCWGSQAVGLRESTGPHHQQHSQPQANTNRPQESSWCWGLCEEPGLSALAWANAHHLLLKRKSLMDYIQSTEFSRPAYWSGEPFPSPGDVSNPGIELRSPALQADSLLTELSVQFSSVSQSCPTLCNPHRSTPGLPVHHQLPEFTQTHVHRVGDAIQPSHPVVSFSSCPQSLPASGSFPMSQLFAWGGQSTGVSALASFLPKNWAIREALKTENNHLQNSDLSVASDENQDGSKPGSFWYSTLYFFIGIHLEFPAVITPTPSSSFLNTAYPNGFW